LAEITKQARSGMNRDGYTAKDDEEIYFDCNVLDESGLHGSARCLRDSGQSWTRARLARPSCLARSAKRASSGLSLLRQLRDLQRTSCDLEQGQYHLALGEARQFAQQGNCIIIFGLVPKRDNEKGDFMITYY